MILEIIALVSTALFAGAAAYVSFVEHPARLECEPTVALKQFRPSYRRGTVMQASLAVLGFAAGIAAWLGGGGRHHLAAALLLGSVVPLTLLVILPTNKQLLAESLDPASSHANLLLRRWGQLHAVRTVLAAVAFAVLVGGGAAR